jgi:Flp pilus assembly protein TadB
MYFLLAATGALVFLTGNILWIESRRKRNKAKLEDFQQTRSSTNMAKLTIGVSMGTIIGLGLALITAKLLPHKQYDIDFYQTLAYYIGFLLPIAWAFWQKPIIAAKQLLLVSSLLALCIPVTSFLQAGPASSWGINLAAIIIAAGFITTFVAINRRKDLIVKDSVWAF